MTTLQYLWMVLGNMWSKSPCLASPPTSPPLRMRIGDIGQHHGGPLRGRGRAFEHWRPTGKGRTWLKKRGCHTLKKPISKTESNRYPGVLESWCGPRPPLYPLSRMPYLQPVFGVSLDILPSFGVTSRKQTKTGSLARVLGPRGSGSNISTHSYRIQQPF